MTKSVAIIDYGIGNILSVSRALEHAGAKVSLATTAAQAAAADYVVLPGVGAFQDGITGLRKKGLADAVQRHAASGRPLLGICLGAQMLATESHEFGRHEGLNLIPGQVIPIPATGSDGTRHKLPFIGWARLKQSYADSFRGSPLSAVSEEESVYLVHSFHVAPTDCTHRTAHYDYNGLEITGAVCRDNVFGFQFHPEKSGPVGLRIIEAFLSC